MTIPFSLPLLDEDVISEVHDALTKTGWITSGPKVRQFEEEIARYTGSPSVVAVNSWTSGAMLALRWFGVGPGDEVIVPAYTYCATALAVMNVGATPVMVDIGDHFNMSLDTAAPAITNKTKAIIPVDIGGWPCDYVALNQFVRSPQCTSQFQPNSPRQEQLRRPLVIADAAHSIGAQLQGRQVGTLTDVTVFSFHSVKNITTGEGGAVCLSLPEPFDNEKEYQTCKYLSLNGQTKSALEKSKVGGWRYDIVDHGLKANMPDICAAIGLAQIRKYPTELLPERRRIFQAYNSALAAYDWAILPPLEVDDTRSSYHLYQLRIAGFGEEERNSMIRHIEEQGIAVNVHYVPLPMLTLFKRLGFDIADVPKSFEKYQGEITLPVYNGLSDESVGRVIDAVVNAHQKVASS